MTFPPDAASTPQRHSAPRRAEPGTVIAERYALTERIGDGGHGTVWRARDQLLQRDVAVKEVVLPPELPPEERQQVCDRTLREAQAAARLSHGAVVRVFDVITEDGRPWIVMELLQARSLADIIASDGPMPPRVVAKIGVALAGALEAAHDAGILHRDVKPGNVMISNDGRCVLSDFGAAAAGSSGTGHTAPGMVLGSAHYIAPERAVGGPAQPTSDLFSLGVTLYTALEGRPPFDRQDTTATMHAVVHDPPEAPRNAGPLTPLLAGLLEKDPERRANVDFTRETLSALLAGPLSIDTPGQGMAATTAQPVQSPPVSGPPTTSPISAHPVSAHPTTGNPMTGYPVAGQPVTGAPVSANPYGGAVVPEQPAPGFPPPGGMPPGNPGSSRKNFAAIGLGVGIIAVVAAIIVTVGVVILGGGEGPDADNASQQSEEAADDIEFESYKDPQGRYTVDIPKGWKISDEGGTFIDIQDPEKPERWLRLNVVDGEGDPEAVLEGAFAGGVSDSFDPATVKKAGAGAAELSGAPGYELEYTGTTKEDQKRHAKWLVASSGGTNFHVYLSVPADTYKDSLPIYKKAVETYEITS